MSQGPVWAIGEVTVLSKAAALEKMSMPSGTMMAPDKDT